MRRHPRRLRPRAIRHQVAAVPPIRPGVIESQLHRLTCPGCGVTARGPLPEGVPPGSFGPRLRALLSLLAAEFRPAKRPIQRLARNFLGPDISLGMVAKLERQTATVLGPVDEELVEPIPPAPETSGERDDESSRHGTANLSVLLEPASGRRHVTVTKRQATPDFAARMKHLCDEMSPEAEVIWVGTG